MSISVLHEEKPTARKQHWCDDCGRAIEKGERYLRQDNVFDGSRYAWKSCEHCTAAFSFMWRHVPDFVDYDEGMHLGEALDEYRHDTLTVARLRYYFRRRWLRNDGSLVPVEHLLTAQQRGGAA